MNKLTFFFAGLLLIPFVLDEVYAQEIERGENFDRILIGVNPDGTKSFSWTSHPQRVFDNGEWKDYILFEDANIIQVVTGQGSFEIDKNTCSLAFYNAGFISGNPIIPSDTYLARQSSDAITWNEVNQINNAVCQTVVIENGNDIEVQTIKSHAIGEMKIRYIKDAGQKLKSQMEVTNTSGLNDRYFGFIQLMQVPQLIRFEGNQIDLATKNGTFFDRDFILANKEQLVRLTDKVHYDFRPAFSMLTGITVLFEDSKAFLEFDYSRNAQILPDGETFVIDPTFGFSSGTDGRISFPTASVIDPDIECDDNPQGGDTIDHSLGMLIQIISKSTNSTCLAGWSVWDITSIPRFIEVDTAVVKWTKDNDVGNTRDCSLRHLETDLRSETNGTAAWFDATQGASFAIAGNAEGCDDAANGTYEVPLNGFAFDEIESQAENELGWFGFGLFWEDKDRVLEVSPRIDFTNATTQIQINYTTAGAPDGVTDLVTGNTTATTIDLAWSEPFLGANGTLSGYQINFSTPHSNPVLTVITNDTGTSVTNFEVSGLTSNTPYSFRVSVWTNVTNNATGNIANTSTVSFGNFTVGFIDIEATNLDFRTWIFLRTDLNSSAYELSVIYPQNYNATCSFHFKFANTDQNFSNLETTIPASNQREAIFTFNNTAGEIIDVLCFNENNFEQEGRFLLTQTDFVLLQQFEQFRDGTFGTMGMFGAIDLITLFGIVFATIGFNRLNESVGGFFMLVILGVMAFFQIIVWPTALSGAIAVVVMLVVMSTRKV